MGNFSTLANRLKTLRISLNMTQKDFAEFVGCTAATLSAYENNSKNPSLDIIKGIAEQCHVSIDWLCGLSEKQSEKPNIRNYEDIAVKIVELCSIDVSPYEFKFKQYEVDITDNDFLLPGEKMYNYEWALTLPENDKFLRFISTYNELNELYKDNRITQDVINTWLNGALEELKAIPINAPTQPNKE